MASPEARSLLILYATETGTAQEVADRIARQCRRIAFHCRVLSTDAYQTGDLISEELVVFVVSTSGSGTEPRTMTPLWTTLLRSDLPSDLFEGLSFAVFGLGDSSYERFCWPAKKLSRRLTSLGAQEICRRGEGDEQHSMGIDGALIPWMSELLDTLLRLYPLPIGARIMPADSLPPPRVFMEETSLDELEKCINPLDNDKSYHTAIVEKNERITSADWYQDVRHFEFSFKDDISYSPGDVAVIHPIASSLNVESFLSSMDWANTADTPYIVKPLMEDQTLPYHLPRATTIRSILTHYVDINAVPRRSFFEYIRYFTSDEMEKEKLDDFLSSEGADDLYDYCHRVKRTIQEVLSDFWHVRIPEEYIFDVFPPMRPREFSIASSIKKHPKSIHLCVAIVKYRTRLKILRKGTCTTYMAALRPGDTLRIGIRRGLIKLPSDPRTPVICVGPGTGIAPMRAVIQERISNGSFHNTLYFGCRSKARDHHYGDEWTTYSSEKALEYRSAFSRDGPEGVKRTYVQDLIKEDSERIWKLVRDKNACVFISGSSNKMPAGVKEALAFSAERHGGYSPEESMRLIDELIREGRLIEECWS